MALSHMIQKSPPHIRIMMMCPSSIYLASRTVLHAPPHGPLTKFLDFLFECKNVRFKFLPAHYTFQLLAVLLFGLVDVTVTWALRGSPIQIDQLLRGERDIGKSRGERQLSAFRNPTSPSARAAVRLALVARSSQHESPGRGNRQLRGHPPRVPMHRRPPPRAGAEQCSLHRVLREGVRVPSVSRQALRDRDRSRWLPPAQRF